MCMAPVEAEPIWRAADHPLFRFAFQTGHPDLDLSGVRPLDAMLPTIDTSRGIANALAQALGEPPVSPVCCGCLSAALPTPTLRQTQQSLTNSL